MPRSLSSCYGEVSDALDGLAALYKKEDTSASLARDTLGLLNASDIDGIFRGGLHEFLTEFIARNDALGIAISDNYHFNG